MKHIGIYLFRSIKILSGAICAFFIFALTTDTGKNSLLNAISFFARINYSVDLKFSELKDNHIKEITAKFPHGATYHIENLHFCFSPKLNIEADKINITSQTSQKQQKTNYKELIYKLKNTLPFLQKYIQSIKIKNINSIQNLEYTNFDDCVHCSAKIMDKNISISLKNKCFISVKDPAQEITLSVNELFSENMVFQLNSSNNLIYAEGSVTNGFTNIDIHGQFKGISFKSSSHINDDLINFTADIFNLQKINQHISSEILIKSTGTLNLSSKIVDVAFSGYSNNKLLFTGKAIGNANELKTNIKWNEWHVSTNLILNNNILNINELNIKHPTITANTTQPVIINLQNKANLFSIINSGQMTYKFADIKQLKDIPYSQYIPKGRGFGYIKINDNKLFFSLKSSDGLLYNDIQFHGCDLEYSRNNDFQILFDDIIYKKHKISNLSLKKYNNYLDIIGKINEQDSIDIKAQLSKDKAIVTLFNINTKDIDISSNKIEILHNKDSLVVSSDKIKLFDGIASFIFECDSAAKKLKLKSSNLSLKNLLFFADKRGKQLARKLSLSTKIDIYTQGDKCLGTAELDINNEKGHIILDSTIKLLNSGIFIYGKYADVHDFMEANLFLPMYLSDQLHINKMAGQKFSGSINASINLRKFLLFSTADRLTLKGQLETQLSISEANSSAVINGACSLSNGAVETPSVSIKNIFINASINNNNIILNKAISSHKKGKMNITGGGKVIIDDIIPQIICDMNIMFNNFDLLSSDSLNCNFTGTVKATGPVQKLTLKGPLTVTHGVYDTSHTESSYQSDIQIKGLNKRKEKILNTEKSSKVQAPFIFDIDGKCKDFRVIGKSIEAILNGDLRVLTFNDALTLDGDLQLSSGYINMIGVRVKLRSGFVKFKKERGISPLVSLHGNSIVKDMQIFLDIDNIKNDHLTIDIRSNPTYSIENIFSKIVFNKPLIGLKVDESAKIRNAVKSLKQESSASFSYFDFLKELMIFDSFSFSNDDTTNAKNGTSTLNAGKYISDNIYIGVEKATEKEAKYKVSINLSPQVRVEANTNGEAGVTWMYRY